jgi:hypothetical protein
VFVTKCWAAALARADLSAQACPVPDDLQRSNLAAISDRILEAIRALKAIELRKRQATPSTPRYHALTEDSADKSREIFAAAAEQDRVARGLEPGGATIEETAEREKDRREA